MSIKVAAALSGCISPDLILDGLDHIELPDKFSIRIGGSTGVYCLLRDYETLLQLPAYEVCGILDVLYLILRRSVYDVVRFRCSEEHRRGSPTFVSILLGILQAASRDASRGNICMRIIRLIGIVAPSGLTASEFKDFLQYLAKPSFLTIPLLQSLKTMLTPQFDIQKASPSSYFCIGGINAGLYVNDNPIDFSHDFQILLWFRVENFVPSAPTSNEYGYSRQHIVSCLNQKNQGFDIFIENNALKLYMSDSRGDPQEMPFEEHYIRKSVWYNLVVSHARPLFSFLNKDRLTVTLDDTRVFEDYINFPREANFQKQSTLVLGHNFDGHIGTVFVFSECMPGPTLDLISKLSAGKSVPGYEDSYANLVLMSSTTAAKDPRLQPVVQKVVAVYHPLRIYNGRAIDVHGGRHALMMQPTFPWSSVVARELVESMGGISFLLPMFPRLLIDGSELDSFLKVDSSDDGYDAWTPWLGESGAEIFSDEAVHAIFCTEVVRALTAEKIKIPDEGCVGLLLSIVSLCFQGHRDTQTAMVQGRLVEMLEYSLAKVPTSVMRSEKAHSAYTLLVMDKGIELKPLQAVLASRLVFNLGIWQRASILMQRSLVAALVEAVQFEPEVYVSSLGIGRILQQAELFPSYVSVHDTTESSSDREGQQLHLYFRNAFYTMIWLMVKTGLSSEDLQPLLAFMDRCKDGPVLTEITQLLLCLLADGGLMFATLIGNACNGAEGFASFVLFRLVTNPSEAVRAHGIRLLTHFYINFTGQSQRNSSYVSSPKGGNFLGLGAADMLGLELFKQTGGFAFLRQIMANYKNSSSLTYAALMEMVVSAHVNGWSLLQDNEVLGRSSGDFDFKTQAALLEKCIFAISPFVVSKSRLDESDQPTISSGMLPVLFDVMSQIDSLDRLQLLGDVFNLLKDNRYNCEIFCAHPDWTVFMLNQLVPLVVGTEGRSVLDQDLIIDLVCNTDTNSRSNLFHRNHFSKLTPFSEVPIRLRPLDSDPNDSTHGLQFSLCLKVFGIVIMHDLEFRANSREIEKMLFIAETLPSTGNALEEFLASRLVLNSVLYELKATVQRRYSGLLKSATGFGFGDRQARDLLENVVATVITVAQYILGGVMEANGVQLFGSVDRWVSLPAGPDTDYAHISALVTDPESKLEALLYLLHRAPAQSMPVECKSSSWMMLDRVVDRDSADMATTLQCLDLFDLIFRSSKGTGVLAGTSYLRYQKDRKPPVAVAYDTSPTPQPTLIESVFLMGIYVLNNLSPMVHSAVANVRRMSLLITSADSTTLRLPSIESLVINLMGECIFVLIRLRKCLGPLYAFLGFADLDDVLRETSQDEIEDYEIVLSQDDIVADKIFDDERLVALLQAMFESEAGVLLSRFLIEVFTLLCRIFERKRQALKEAGDSTLVEQLMTSFVGRVRLEFPQLTADSTGSQSHSKIFDANSASESGDLYYSPKKYPSSDSEARHGSRPSSGRLSRSPSRLSDTNNKDSSSDISDQPDVDESIEISDVVSLLSCLRDPFLLVSSAVELLRNRYSMHVFADALSEDLKTVRTTSVDNGQRGTMALGRMPTWSDATREKLLSEASSAIAAAHNWKCCLSKFEVEWSPWMVAADSKQTAFELTRHRDSLLRHNLLTKALDSTDYLACAHYGSKKSYQLLYGQQNSLAGASPNKTVHTSKIIKRMFSKKVTGGWGEGEFLFEAPVEELSGKKLQHIRGVELMSDEREMYTSETNLVELEKSTIGTLYLTNKHLYFMPRKVVEKSAFTSNKSQPLRTRRWVLECLIAAYGRRHLLKNCGIELFFAESLEVFFAFNSLNELQKFFFLMRRQNLPRIVTPVSLDPTVICAHQQWTELWRKRLISNFEYLTRLNTIAGRSYNDISQYPVFPWVIADYNSTVLDLTKPESFRDLSRPIGALNDSKHQEIMDRYTSSFDEDDLPSFMYGSHYSSAGVVLHYMIRQEPFTGMAVHFQGGRFDVPDRLFFAVNRTWEGLQNSLADVKELIPEFFCCPEIFINSNALPLGELQEGGEVEDVILPPWAKDAYDFVRQQREALESDYVSENLHHWINLIFGYKQTGDAAVEAKNVFSYLTYENSIDIDLVTDEIEREAIIATVTNFGQTPSQIFDKPHPQRLSRSQCEPQACGHPDSVHALAVHSPPLQLQGQGAAICVRVFGEKLVVCFEDLTVVQGKWGDLKGKQLPSASLSINASLNASRKSSMTIVDISSTRIASCGYWDDSIRIHALDTLKEVASTTSGHNGPVNCIQLDRVGNHMVFTGGVDGTCRVWVLENASIVSSFHEWSGSKEGSSSAGSSSLLVCVHVLCGHHNPITSLSYSPELDLILSSSADGSLCLHSVKSGEFVKMVAMPSGTSIDCVYLAPQGFLIAHSWTDLQLAVYSLNSHKLATSTAVTKLECFTSNPLSNILVCGSSSGNLLFLNISDLSEMRMLEIIDCPGVKCFSFAEEYCYILLGSSTGNISICMDPASRIKHPYLG